MRILIATAGALAPEPVASFADQLLGADGTAVVVTVIEVPRSFLDSIKSEEWHPLAESSADWSAPQDQVITRYVEERGSRIAEPILAALRSREVAAETMYLEGTDAAATIIEAAEEIDADLLILGATKPLFDEWESVSARVIRESQRAVLVVPTVAHDALEQMA